MRSLKVQLSDYAGGFDRAEAIIQVERHKGGIFLSLFDPSTNTPLGEVVVEVRDRTLTVSAWDDADVEGAPAAAIVLHHFVGSPRHEKNPSSPVESLVEAASIKLHNMGDKDVSADAYLRLVMKTGQSIPIPPGTWVLGRNPSSNIQVEHASVSFDHALLTGQYGIVAITDLGSSNGTRVNGRALSPNEKVTLNAGDVLALGLVEFQLLPPVAQRIAPAGRTEDDDINRTLRLELEKRAMQVRRTETTMKLGA